VSVVANLERKVRVMAEAFHLGGWGMWPTLLFGLLLLASAARYAWKPQSRWLPLTAALGLLTLLSGGLGFVMGAIRATTTGSSGAVDLAVTGIGESAYNVALALVFAVIAAVAGSLGALRLARESGHR
jgi:hypothetical protein